MNETIRRGMLLVFATALWACVPGGGETEPTAEQRLEEDLAQYENLEMGGSELSVSAQDLDFSNEASEKLVCEYQGTPMEIGFNAKFLLEMLSALDCNDINIELSTPNRAGIIRPADKDESENWLMLVMPVMLNN